MSDGANHFDTSTQAGIEAMAWWESLTESERINLLVEANTNEPCIARLHWLRKQRTAAATETEPSPVSPPVSRSVAAALLASLEELLADAEDCARADSEMARAAPEFLSMIRRARAARDLAKAGGL